MTQNLPRSILDVQSVAKTSATEALFQHW